MKHDHNRPLAFLLVFLRNVDKVGSQRPNVGAAQRNVADVEFFSAMLDDLTRRFNVDTRRVYVTGFSNGASMSFRVAREL